MKVPDNLIPLIYLIVTGGLGALLFYIGVPDTVTGIVIGAGLTRVKKSSDGIG